jgi:hypothetical protein
VYECQVILKHTDHHHGQCILNQQLANSGRHRNEADLVFQKVSTGMDWIRPAELGKPGLISSNIIKYADLECHPLSPPTDLEVPPPKS